MSAPLTNQLPSAHAAIHATSMPLPQACLRYPEHMAVMRTFVRALTQDVRDVSLLAGPTTRTQSVRHSIYDAAWDVVNGPSWTCGGARRAGVGMHMYGSYATATAIDASDANVTLLAHTSSPAPLAPEDLWALGDALQATHPWMHVERLPSANLPRIVCTSSCSSGAIDPTLRSRPNRHPPGSSTLRVVFTINQTRGLRHAELLGAFTATYPAFQPMLVALKALHRELMVPDEEMTSVVLTWTAVAFYLHHVARIAAGHSPVSTSPSSSPGQALVAFLHFFQTDGAFDPRRHTLQPGHPVGILERSVPSSLSTWVLVDPIQLPPTGSNTSTSTTTIVGGSGGRADAQRSMAAGCYMAHRFRDTCAAAFQRIVRNYSHPLGSGGLGVALQQPLPPPTPGRLPVATGDGSADAGAPTDTTVLSMTAHPIARSPHQEHLLQLLFPALLSRLAAQRHGRVLPSPTEDEFVSHNEDEAGGTTARSFHDATDHNQHLRCFI